MDFLIKYSGIFSMLLAWLLLVLPGLKAGIDRSKETISDATRKKKYRDRINLGLIIGAIFQTIFLFSIVGKFSLRVYSFGTLLFLSTTIATVLVAIFVKWKHRLIHDFFTRYYFVLNPLAVLIIGFTFKDAFPQLFLVSSALVLLYFVGEFYLILRYKTDNALMQILAFFLLSVWTITMTFY